MSDDRQVDVTIRIANTTDAERDVTLSARLSGPGGAWASEPLKTHLAANGAAEVEVTIPEIEGARVWSIDDPALYRFEVELDSGDRDQRRVGFRMAEFQADGRFYLNGQPLSLRGLNRHQTYPYIGAAAPARLQRRDAEIIKRDLACNIVRTSHYPQSPHFLDACDELGLLVFEETPGWQHLGDEAWKDLVARDVRDMIVPRPPPPEHHPLGRSCQRIA